VSLYTLTLIALLSGYNVSAQVHAPVPKISCVMANHGYQLQHYDKETQKLTVEEMDDFWVGGYNDEDKTGCTITISEKVIYSGALRIVHPASSADALAAIDEFRTKKASLILKDAAKKP
jgi:hypothetical protein